MTIQGITAGTVTGVTGSPQSTATPAPVDTDGGGSRLSGFAQFLGKLQDLEQSDPVKAKQVLGDIATKLRDRAGQSSGDQSTRLNQMADQFQKAADTGNLSALQPAKGHHGHHGHHGHQAKGAQAYSQSSDQGQSLVNMFNSELSGATSNT